VSASASSLLTLNPTIVNLELGLYGLLFVCVFVYVHMKFRKADRVLATLKKEWDGAESKHVGLVEFAQHQLTNLAAVPAVINPPAVTPAVSQRVTSDTRNQVAAMGRRGIPLSEIARSCGLPEGEVDVLLSMARMQRTEA
jgi:DNA-directed RNA polymerase specialized sigma24 family protein